MLFRSERSLEALQSQLAREIIPIQLPLGEEKHFTGVVDLIRMKALTFAADASGKMPEGEIPAALADSRREIHAVLKQANYDIARHQFNTVASAGMKMLNALEAAQKSNSEAALKQAVVREGLSLLLRLLSPMTPHICHQLWRDLGYGEDILDATWPEPDAAALTQAEIELVVQVNGKKRGSVRVPREADAKAVEALTLADAQIQQAIGGKPVKKVVVVPGRLVNVVA